MIIGYENTIKDEYKALNEAIAIGHLPDFIRLFAELGEYPYVTLQRDLTVLDVAILQNKPRIIAYLLSNDDRFHASFQLFVDKVDNVNTNYTRLHKIGKYEIPLVWYDVVRRLVKDKKIPVWDKYIEFVKSTPANLQPAISEFNGEFINTANPEPGRKEYEEIMYQVRMHVVSSNYHNYYYNYKEIYKKALEIKNKFKLKVSDDEELFFIAFESYFTSDLYSQYSLTSLNHIVRNAFNLLNKSSPDTFFILDYFLKLEITKSYLLTSAELLLPFRPHSMVELNILNAHPRVISTAIKTFFESDSLDELQDALSVFIPAIADTSDSYVIVNLNMIAVFTLLKIIRMLTIQYKNETDSDKKREIHLKKSDIIKCVLQRYDLIIPAMIKTEIATGDGEALNYLFNFIEHAETPFEKYMLLKKQLEINLLAAKVFNKFGIEEQSTYILNKFYDGIIYEHKLLAEIADWHAVAKNTIECIRLSESNYNKKFYLLKLDGLIEHAKIQQNVNLEYGLKHLKIDFLAKTVKEHSCLIDTKVMDDLDSLVKLVEDRQISPEKIDFGYIYEQFADSYKYKQECLIKSAEAYSKTDNRDGFLRVFTEVIIPGETPGEAITHHYATCLDLLSKETKKNCFPHSENFARVRQLKNLYDVYNKYRFLSPEPLTKIEDLISKAYVTAFSNVSEWKDIAEYYFPAMLRLALNAINNASNKKSLFLAAQTICHLMYKPELISQKFGFTEQQIIDNKNLLRMYISQIANDANNQLHLLAGWYTEFLLRFELFCEKNPDIQSKHFDITSFILADSNKYHVCSIPATPHSTMTTIRSDVRSGYVDAYDNRELKGKLNLYRFFCEERNKSEVEVEFEENFADDNGIALVNTSLWMNK